MMARCCISIECFSVAQTQMLTERWMLVLLYFELSLWFVVVLIVASLVVSIKFKKYLIVPIVSLCVFAIHAVIEYIVNRSGIGSLVGWMLVYTAVVSLSSLVVWIVRKLIKR